MKLLPGIIVSGAALAFALVLCAAIHSPTLWLITWICCIGYGLVVLGTSLYIAIRRSTDRIEEKIRRDLNL
jgi:hypothetical protein